jgi:hypothetical protein
MIGMYLSRVQRGDRPGGSLVMEDDPSHRELVCAGFGEWSTIVEKKRTPVPAINETRNSDVSAVAHHVILRDCVPAPRIAPVDEPDGHLALLDGLAELGSTRRPGTPGCTYRGRRRRPLALGEPDAGTLAAAADPAGAQCTGARLGRWATACTVAAGCFASARDSAGDYIWS